MASTRKFAPLARDAMAYVLAGGRGSRLMELTDKRAKPAVYFAGKTRIIDFALSNALNSGIRRMGVATQYKVSAMSSGVIGCSPLYIASAAARFPSVRMTENSVSAMPGSMEVTRTPVP